jgi:hypothetical protein
MPEKSNPRRSIDFRHERFTQISESHCGPAVIQMLLQYIGIEVPQEAVAEAGGATALIEVQGARRRGQAVNSRLANSPWYKIIPRLETVRIVNDYDYLVGSNVGVFEDRWKMKPKMATGHYSVSRWPTQKKEWSSWTLRFTQYRIFLRFFTPGWWMNEVQTLTRKGRLLGDRR